MRKFQKRYMLLIALLVLFFCTVFTISAETVTLKNGIELRYITEGRGRTPIIFIHGYSFSADMWEMVLSRLPRQYKGYAYDLRGFGDSSKPESGYGLADYAEDLSQFMEALNISKAILVGHSLGGILLQDFAVEYPEKVIALVLSNPQARHVDSGGKVPDSIAQRLASYGDREANRRVFEAATPRYFMPGNLSDTDLQRFIEINLKSGNAALRESFAALFTTPAIPMQRFSRIEAPTLIVAGTHDIVPWSVDVALSEGIPQSRIFVVERAGHTPMWENPDRFCEGLFQFLDSVR